MKKSLLTLCLLISACATTSFEDKIETIESQKTYRISTEKNNVELYDLVKENKLCPGFYSTEGKDVGMIPNPTGRVTYNIYTIKCMKD